MKTQIVIKKQGVAVIEYAKIIKQSFDIVLIELHTTNRELKIEGWDHFNNPTIWLSTDSYLTNKETTDVSFIDFSSEWRIFSVSVDRFMAKIALSKGKL